MNARQLAAQYGMMDAAEVDLLQRCARALPAHSVIVNIGAGAGTSAVAVLEVAPTAFIFSIDPKPVAEEAQRIAETGMDARRVVRILGKSQAVGAFWPFAVDGVFVDGNHTDEAVRGDIAAWKKHIKPSGFMWFHDYHHYNLPSLSPIVDAAMADWERIGEARFLVAFRRGAK